MDEIMFTVQPVLGVSLLASAIAQAWMQRKLGRRHAQRLAGRALAQGQVAQFAAWHRARASSGDGDSSSGIHPQVSYRVDGIGYLLNPGPLPAHPGGMTGTRWRVAYVPAQPSDAMLADAPPRSPVLTACLGLAGLALIVPALLGYSTTPYQIVGMIAAIGGAALIYSSRASNAAFAHDLASMEFTQGRITRLDKLPVRRDRIHQQNAIASSVIAPLLEYKAGATHHARHVDLELIPIWHPRNELQKKLVGTTWRIAYDPADPLDIRFADRKPRRPMLGFLLLIAGLGLIALSTLLEHPPAQRRLLDILPSLESYVATPPNEP